VTGLTGLPGSVHAALHDEPVPDWRTPTLATLTDKRFSDSQWIFDRKFDGMRCLAFRDGERVRLLSRNRQPLNATYPELVDALAASPKWWRPTMPSTGTDKRGGRVYLDIMRNAYAQTAVAPYSVRARAGAPVATPLEWDELDARGLRADRFTIRDVPKRLAGQRDPWADMSRHARSLRGPAERLAKRCV